MIHANANVNVLSAAAFKDGGSIRFTFDDTTIVWEDHRLQTPTEGKLYLNELGSHSIVKQEYRDAISYYKRFGTTPKL